MRKGYRHGIIGNWNYGVAKNIVDVPDKPDYVYVQIQYPIIGFIPREIHRSKIDKRLRLIAGIPIILTNDGEVIGDFPPTIETEAAHE